MGRRFSLVYVLVLAMLAGGSAVAGAAPKTGCPAGDWEELTVSEATDLIWPALLDPTAFGDEAGLATVIDTAWNRNGDDSVCVKTLWGEDLNPKSHWYKVGMEILGGPTQLFILRDNNANASNT